MLCITSFLSLYRKRCSHSLWWLLQGPNLPEAEQFRALES